MNNCDDNNGDYNNDCDMQMNEWIANFRQLPICISVAAGRVQYANEAVDTRHRQTRHQSAVVIFKYN